MQTLRATLSLIALGLAANTAGAQCESWTPGFEIPGSNDTVYASLVHDDGSGPALFVGGSFTAFSGTEARRVARWSGSGWEPVGEGIGDAALGAPRVRALAEYDDGSGAALYAGGDFDAAGGMAAEGVARWDGAAWSAVAHSVALGGAPGSVRALAAFDDGSGSALYVGGRFDSIDGAPVEYLARWDGNSWSQVGGGTNPYVNDLLVFDDGTGPALFVAGEFSQTGGVPSEGISRWDGTSWTALIGGVQLTAGNALGADVGGSALVASADVVGFGEGIVRWDGSAWSVLGTYSMDVSDFAVYDDGNGEQLYSSWAGGSVFDGTMWGAVGSAPRPNSALTLAVHDFGSGPELFAGGQFDMWDRHDVARYDGSTWTALVEDTGHLDDWVKTLDVVDLGGGEQLFAGGRFTFGSGEELNCIAAWTGSTWSPVGDGFFGFPLVHDITAFDHGSGPLLYATGDFTSAGPLSLDGIARWDGTAWSSIGNLDGPNPVGSTFARYDDGSGEALYVGGFFRKAGGLVVNKIARWDGTAWSSLAGGMSTGPGVNTLIAFDDGDGPSLFAGGTFSVAGGTAVSNIARWDGSAWHDVGGGVAGGAVRALAVFDDGSGPALFAGGTFATAGGVASPNLARWDGTAWAAPAGGTPDLDVNALEVHDDGSGAGPALLAAGDFVSVGGVQTGTAARFDGSSWSGLDGGPSSTVWALASFDDGSAPTASLFVGGWFQSAGTGGLDSGRVARWSNACPCQATSYCTAGTTTNGCNALVSATGSASVSQASGFDVSVNGVEGAKSGLIFFGTSGAKATPWGAGSSFFCVRGPHQRTPVQAGGGTSGLCDGSFALDFNAWMAANPVKAPASGETVWLQAWFRDPPASKTTAFSDALRFSVCP